MTNTANPQPVLKVSNLSIGLLGKTTLVNDVSFDLQPGRILALVGESGSGKTMIGRSILRLLPDGIGQTGGSLVYQGQALEALSMPEMRGLRGNRIGMVFQEPLVSLNPALRIGEQMAEALRLHRKLPDAEIRKLSIEMLKRIRITDPEACLSAFPHQFSGGMRQRIMLASVMLLKPDLLIADEPTTALDTLSQKQVIETMVDLTRQLGTSVLLITHNLGLVAEYADDIVVLRRGEVVEHGSAKDVVANPAHEYTRELIASLPRRSNEVAKAVAGAPLLQVRNVEVSYPNSAPGAKEKTKRVLQGVTLSIHPGETVAVVGGSGSGKTTLGRAMLRLVDTSAGEVLHGGADITALPDRKLRDFRKSCQIVFQDPFSSLDPRMRVGQLVEEALRHERGLTRAQRSERVTRALADVGLPGYEARHPHQLSGGQRQRVAIARAIAGNPDLIVADEPISALDMTVQKQILTLFKRLQDEHGFAYVFISHDLAAVQQVAQRIVVMHEGRIVEEGSRDEIFDRPQHQYTRELLAASPLL